VSPATGGEDRTVNLRLGIVRLGLPNFLKKRKLAELFRLTGRAFDEDPPAAEGLSLRQMRRLYAEFSSGAAARALGDPAGAADVERRLFEAALEFGRAIRDELRVTSSREVMAAARVLYRGLGIDFRGATSGEIVVRRCDFESHYSPEVCRLMSRLDAGVLAGLAWGGRLEFSERLTEGASCCRARFTFPEGGP
jgi:hypothetical protein